MSVKFDYKRVPVWVNKQTLSPCFEKPRRSNTGNYWYFASKSEYECFLGLKRCLPKDVVTLPQQPVHIADTRWLVDFKLSIGSFSTSLLLSSVFDYFNPSNKRPVPSEDSELYIEYKGLQNKEFINRMKTIRQYPKVDDRLLLLSSKGECYYDELGNGYYIKTLPTIRKFQEVLQWLNTKT